MAERITADVRDALGEADAPREIGGDRVHLGLQLEGGDMAPDRVREVACRPTNPGADLEHAALGSQPEGLGRGGNRGRAVIVPLVQGKQPLGRDRLGRPGSPRREPPGDPIPMRQDPPPAPSPPPPPPPPHVPPAPPPPPSPTSP